jgi:ADP-heptose:LPS heptosyltransferase
LPQCRWSYLASPYSAETLANNPALDEIVPWNKGENSWELADGKFAELRRREFDVVLCTNTLRHYPDLALSIALGIPNRVAFSYKGLSGLITRAAPINFPSPYPAYFRGMVADLIATAPDWPLIPRVYPTENDESAAARTLDSLGIADRSSFIVCSITTRQPAGSIARSHLLAAIESAHAERSFEVILSGAPQDSAELTAAARQLSFPVHVIDKPLGLLAFAELLRRSSAVVCLDSGPRHLGNAVGAPVLFLRNLSQSLIETGKYCETEIDLAPPVEYLSDEAARAVVSGIPAARSAASLLDVIASAAARSIA